MQDSPPLIASTVYAVEATGFEVLTLWRENHQRRTWVQESPGYLIRVGTLADMPVCVHLHWATINGRRLLFWEAVSLVTDGRQIHTWFTDNGVTRTCGAMNFHLALEYIDGLPPL